MLERPRHSGGQGRSRKGFRGVENKVAVGGQRPVAIGVEEIAADARLTSKVKEYWSFIDVTPKDDDAKKKDASSGESDKEQVGTRKPDRIRTTSENRSRRRGSRPSRTRFGV